MKKNKMDNIKIGKFKIIKVLKKQLPGYLFISPWILGFLIFVLWAMIQSFRYSMSNVVLTPGRIILVNVGFNNYRNVFLQDMSFVQTLLSFFISSILEVPVIVVFALIIALLLNGDLRLKGFFRTLYFLPVVIVSGPVMDKLISQGATTVPIMNTAVITNILSKSLPQWLSNPIVTLFEQVIIILWYSGVQILIFLAALQKVDNSLYEAAKIDGGSAWECFWKITLPTIKPMIFLNAIYTLVTLANSDQNNIITLIYNDMFSAIRGYGFASAMAWMYAIILSIMILLISLMFKEKREGA